MRRVLPLFLCLLFLAPAALCETQAERFIWTLSVSGAGDITPTAMAPSVNGGVFIAGTTTDTRDDLGAPLGEQDAFILRVGPGGSVLWRTRLGGSAEDTLTAIAETPDGGCIALGSTLSIDGDAKTARGGQDAWLIRLSAAGKVVWSKCLGGALDDELTGIQVTEDGNYFVFGRTQSRNGDLRANLGGWDAWAALLGPEDGKPLWIFREGLGGDDRYLTAQPVHDGWLLLGEIAEEYALDSEGNPLYTIRPFAQLITQEGEPGWETYVTLGDTGDNRLHEVVETDTGWLIGGETNSRSALMPPSHGGKDFWLLHLRANGTVSWQRTYGGSREERLAAIYPLPSGGYMLLGETRSKDGQVRGAHGSSDLWLVSIKATGVLEWQQPIGGSGESSACGILLTADGGYLIAGTTPSQDGDIGRHIAETTGFLTRLGPNGNLLSAEVVLPSAENRLVQLSAQDGVGYLLAITYDASGNAALWLGRLREGGFISQ